MDYRNSIRQKIVILTLLFAFSFPVTSQAVYVYTGKWKECECAICGKTIYVYQEDYDYFNVSGGGMPWCPGDGACELSSDTRHVCPECETKYRKDFDKCVEGFFVKRRFENLQLVEQYEKERKRQAVEDHRDRIKILQKELEDLKNNGVQ